jgi:methyl halide transferase
LYFGFKFFTFHFSLFTFHFFRNKFRSTMLDKNYWQARYENGDMGWDTGAITTPIKAYVDHLVAVKAPSTLKVLIPGAGSGYEAAYLWQHGFHQVYVCDWADEAMERLKKNAPDFPHSHLLIGDFFQLNDKFDVIIEQTFFCAIDPAERPRYAEKAAKLLNCPADVPKTHQDWAGTLAGVLFGKNFPFQGPPFGGTQEEYGQYFNSFFEIVTMEECYNSIKPRANAELWINLRKKCD